MRYLSEIAEANRSYDKWAAKQATVAGRVQALQKAADEFTSDESTKSAVSAKADEVQLELDHKMLSWLEGWPALKARYKEDVFSYEVRGKEINIQQSKRLFRTKAFQKSPSPLSLDGVIW